MSSATEIPAGKARIAPLPASEWSRELTEFTAQFRSTVVADPTDASRPAGANIMGTLANHPGLAIPFLTFNTHLLAANSLSNRVKELVILRVAHVRRCDYEWAQHTVLAGDADITSAEIARVAKGPAAAGWTPFERGLLTAVDELLIDGTITTDTWNEITTTLDQQQLLDLVFTVGCYAMSAMAMCGFAVELEDELVPYLPGPTLGR